MKTHCVIVPWLLVLTVVPCAAAEPAAWFQAHRGALDERPENTLPAIEHAWGLPGAVPEVDLRTTKDGVIVCIHDKTPARTTDAPETWAGKPIAEIPYDVLATWDACAPHRRQAGTPGLPSQKQLRANGLKRCCFCTSVSVL